LAVQEHCVELESSLSHTSAELLLLQVRNYRVGGRYAYRTLPLAEDASDQATEEN
jgi:hypothetical protein